MKKLRSFRVIIFFFLAGIIVFILSQPFLRRALWYTTADIDDYTIFENRIIHAATPQPWLRAQDYNKKAIPDTFLTHFNALETVAFVVVQDNKILHEQYWDGYTDSSLSNSFSVAKSIVSLLIGIAIDEGKIKSIEQKVGKFIPEFAKGANAQLSIKDVLTMSSGLDWDEAYVNPFSVTTKAYYGDDLLSLIKELKVIEEPGKYFNYQSGNTQLLAMIVEKATGMKISEYAAAKLWQPLGAQHNALWSLDKENGDEKAYCCFNSNALDFARIGQLVLNKGMWQGKRIISEEYLQKALEPARYLQTKSGKEVDFYGYQFWIVDYKGMQIPYARGILGQYIFILPQKNAVVVRLGKKRGERVEEHLSDIFLYLDAALALVE